MMDLIEGEIQKPLSHWYYAHKFAWINRLISKRLPESTHLIDVGAGSALFSLELSNKYENLSCTAIDTGYQGENLCKSSRNFTYLSSGSNISGDIYLFTDVLEHVENPIDLLKQYSSQASSGAAFVITVPALSILWSGHDVFLHHFKRYTLSELNSVIEKAGLRVLKSNYIYVPLFPVALIFRKLPGAKKRKSQMRKNSQILNFLFKKILYLDFFLSKFLPFGVSVIALAEKR